MAIRRVAFYQNRRRPCRLIMCAMHRRTACEQIKLHRALIVLDQNMILPVVKSLYLCEGHIGFANQKSDLIAIFDAIRPAKYPHRHSQFVVYARLSQCQGQVPFHIDIRFASTYQLVHATNPNVLQFPYRDKLVEMIMTMKNVRFAQPGVYLVELYCDNQWAADTTVELL